MRELSCNYLPPRHDCGEALKEHDPHLVKPGRLGLCSRYIHCGVTEGPPPVSSEARITLPSATQNGSLDSAVHRYGGEAHPAHHVFSNIPPSKLAARCRNLGQHSSSGRGHQKVHRRGCRKGESQSAQGTRERQRTAPRPKPCDAGGRSISADRLIATPNRAAALPRLHDEHR